MKKALILSMVGFVSVYGNKALSLQELDTTTTPTSDPYPETTTDTTTTDTTTPDAYPTEPVPADTTPTDTNTTPTDDTVPYPYYNYDYNTTDPVEPPFPIDENTEYPVDVVPEYEYDFLNQLPSPVDVEIPKFTVTLDKSKVQNFLKQAEAFKQSDAAQHVKDARANVIKETANLYKNTVAKIALNFGKHVAPILEDAGELGSDVQVVDTCDEHCATACFQPEVLLQGGVNVFDTDCLADCGCHLKLEKLNEKDAEKAAKKFQKLLKQADKLEAFVDDAFNNQNKTNLEWAVSEYEFQTAVHQQEFIDYVKTQAATALQCEPGCVNVCLDQEWIEFGDIPNCLKWCDCKQGVLDITVQQKESEYNLPELIDYTEQDKQAWSFFKLVQKKLF